MSADNWAICPRCKHNAEVAKEKQIKKANNAYGKVEPEKYLALRTEAEKKLEIDTTLREDYRIGINSDGEFYVSYFGICSHCGFQFDYDHKQKID